MSSDPGTASPAGSPALVGQDGAFSGHEVPGGEAVQLLGKPTKHLLVRPAASQRCVDGSSSRDVLWNSSLFLNCHFLPTEGSLRRRKSRPQASLTATHSSTLAEEIVSVLRTLHSLGQWNSMINDYINAQLSSIGDVMAGCQSEAVSAIAVLRNFSVYSTLKCVHTHEWFHQ